MKQVINGATLTTEQRAAFFKAVYPPARCEFLVQHGAWRYRGWEHTWAVVDDSDAIMAYCAVIPARLRVQHSSVAALWWVDLVVLPQQRGQGLQTLLDAEIQRLSATKLGFPNALAAQIHRKHGWGVTDQARVVQLPLRPRQLRTVRRAHGTTGLLLKSAAQVLALPSALLCQRWQRYQPRFTKVVAEPAAEALAHAFQYMPAEWITIERDADFLRWRYLEAPDRANLVFYNAADRLILIGRWQHEPDGSTAFHILDLFGAVCDHALLEDMLRTVRRDAVRGQAAHVTALLVPKALITVFRRHGFLLSRTVAFCWLSSDTAIMHTLEQQPTYWVAGDSDFDEAL